jgi:hypothetical protein
MKTTQIFLHPKQLTRVAAAFFILTLVASFPAIAQEHQEQATGPPPHVQMPPGIERATDDETGHGHHWHKHHAGVLLGGSSLRSETGFTIGGDYEYRFTKYVGLGVQAEHAFGELKETVFAFPVFFHPGGGLRLATGPGFERFTGELPTGTNEDVHEEETEHDQETHFLWRMQVLYDFPVGKRYTITPNIAVDFQSGRQVWVYGVTFGVGF